MVNATSDFFLGIMVRSWALDGNLLEGWFYLPIDPYTTQLVWYIFASTFTITIFPNIGFLGIIYLDQIPRD